MGSFTAVPINIAHAMTSKAKEKKKEEDMARYDKKVSLLRASVASPSNERDQIATRGAACGA